MQSGELSVHWQNSSSGTYRESGQSKFVEQHYQTYTQIDIPVTHSLTLLTNPRSKVPLENLTGFQLVKKFPAFYATRKFITAFTSARHLSLSWASLIQSIPPHRTSYGSILILSSHLRLGLSSGLFPSGFPTKTMYTPLLSPMHATCPALF